MCNLIKILLVVFSIGITLYEHSHADDSYLVALKTNKTRLIQKRDKKEKIVPIDFIKIPTYRSINDSGLIYKDVLEHSKQNPFGDESGRNINVHETAHGIHSEIRNSYEKELKRYDLNAFYCLNGDAILLKEPKVTIRHVIKYVPEKLRSYRWKLYFVEQLKDWDDKPTYILDEWVAYILGSKCAVDDHQKGIITHRSDAVSGCLDFSIYATAFAMAVKEHDPEYWNKQPQFKAMINYHLIQAEKTLGAGLDIEAFNSEKQDRLYYSLLYDESAEEIRKFLVSEFDGVFIQ